MHGSRGIVDVWLAWLALLLQPHNYLSYSISAKLIVACGRAMKARKGPALEQGAGVLEQGAGVLKQGAGGTGC